MNSSQVIRKSSHPYATALTLIFFACLVLIPALLQHEPLKWHAAKAIAQYENGDRDAAIKSLQQVAPKLASDYYVQSKMIDWLMAAGQADKAVEYCNGQLERDPQSATWLLLRREAECGAGDFKAAWQTHKELRSLEVRSLDLSAEDLNEQAYFRALADEDLQIAKSEIQKAVTKVSYASGIPNFQLPLPSQALVSASLLSRQAGAQLLVMPQLNRRIDAVERVLGSREKRLADSLEVFSKGSFPLSETQESLLEDFRLKIELSRREISSLTVCRALMHEDLMQLDRCDADRVRVAESGLQPQAVADSLPSDDICYGMAFRAITYLDTRAFVLTKLRLSDSDQLAGEESTGLDAVADLDIAVTACEVLARLLQASNELTEQNISGFNKLYATVLSHRVGANKKAGDVDSVESDRERIRSLGFDPDENLY